MHETITGYSPNFWKMSSHAQGLPAARLRHAITESGSIASTFGDVERTPARSIRKGKMMASSVLDGRSFDVGLLLTSALMPTRGYASSADRSSCATARQAMCGGLPDNGSPVGTEA
jgi:hypothetical protein